MSRIEKAIEAATEMRKSHSSAKECVQAPKDHCYPVSDADPREIRNPYIVSLNDSCSAIAEEFRKLKSGVVKLTRRDSFENVIIITSALDGEGKSITAINLAITLAQGFDHSVLLVDADLRRPSLSRYLNIPAEQGLSDCLLNEAELSSTLIRTGWGKLSFLPSGKKVERPAELFSSQGMRELIKDLKHRYHDRYIIIDTPPVLPFAETRVLSSYADGIVFVVREGVPSLQNVSEALEKVKDTRILGIVYNNVDLSAMNGSYYHYARDYYPRKRGEA